MAAEYAKCSGCKCLRHIVDEYEVYKGTRRKTCLKCKESRNKNKCKHGKIKRQCKDCGGSQICEHGKFKSQCKECGGSQICEHGKRKSDCKECGGSAFCEHGKFKSNCKDCNDSSFCEHGKRKCQCKDCGGSEICEHGKQKSHCKECGGSQICEHGKLKRYCRDCGGTSICEHGKHKIYCKECGGSQICEHGKQKRRCKECDQYGYLSSIVSVRVRQALKADKSKKSIEYLGCTIEQFKEHIGFQFETGMSWDNYGEVWQIDHIIPIKYEQGGKEPSLEDTIERLHWTNTQPMFAEENIAKSNKFIGKISEYDKAIKEMCLAFNALENKN